MIWQDPSKMRVAPSGPMPGPPPTCGMPNVLCRLSMADIGAVIAGARQPNLRVHVGAVEMTVRNAGGRVARSCRDFDPRTPQWVEDRIMRRRGSFEWSFGLGAEIIDVDGHQVPSQANTHDPPCRPMLAEAGLVPCADDGIRQTLFL